MKICKKNTRKPQSNHPHSLFAKNLNIFLPFVGKPQSTIHITYLQATFFSFLPLVWKPQSSHLHSLFARKLKFLKLCLSPSVHWRLSKICSFVFHLMAIPQTCVSFCNHSSSLRFILSPLFEPMFCFIAT